MLSHDILLVVFSFSDLNFLHEVGKVVSKGWYRLLEDPHTWRLLLLWRFLENNAFPFYFNWTPPPYPNSNSNSNPHPNPIPNPNPNSILSVSNSNSEFNLTPPLKYFRMSGWSSKSLLFYLDGVHHHCVNLTHNLFNDFRNSVLQEQFFSGDANLTRIKIVLLGDAHSGKSALIHRFKYGFEEEERFPLNYLPNDEGLSVRKARVLISPQTPLIYRLSRFARKTQEKEKEKEEEEENEKENDEKEKEKDFFKEEEKIGGKFCVLSIVDSSGREEFRPKPTPLSGFLYKDSCILLVFDRSNADSFANLEKVWLPDLKMRGADHHGAARILIGNKSDLKPKVSRDQALKLAAKYGLLYAETSALHPRGPNQVEKVFFHAVALVLDRRKN